MFGGMRSNGYNFDIPMAERFERHVFVCTNRREDGNPKGCCASKGAQALRDEMKKRAAELGLHGKVRINNAGCLDACEKGIAMVVYPEQVWYQAVCPSDIDTILKQHIIGGEIVETCLLNPHTQKTILPKISPKKKT